MRRIGLGVLATVTIGCGTSSLEAVAPSPFPDVLLGEVSDFQTPSMITELVVPHDLIIVAGIADEPVAFARKDPNNGCRLGLAGQYVDAEWVDDSAAFVDVCHGNQYDLAGEPVADSAENPMRTVPTAVRDGMLVWTRDGVREAMDASSDAG